MCQSLTYPQPIPLGLFWLLLVEVVVHLPDPMLVLVVLMQLLRMVPAERRSWLAVMVVVLIAEEVLVLAVIPASKVTMVALAVVLSATGS